MAFYRDPDGAIPALADAIREKTGRTDAMTPAQMAEAVRDMELGETLPDAEGTTFGYMKATETITEKAPEGKCWYNGVLLPEIPADVLEEYPYAFIGYVKSSGRYQILASKQTMYVANSSITRQNRDDEPFLYCSDGDEVWSEGSPGSYGWSIDSARVLVWSNRDLPNGSATATAIYFEGSEPVTEVTETVSEIVPVEREEQYTITSDTLNLIAKRTQEMAGTSKLLTPADIIYWLGRVLYTPQGYATTGYHLEPMAYGSKTTGIVPTVYRGGASSVMVLDAMTFGSAASGVLEE